MQIHRIVSEDNTNTKYATVSLNYDELRDISNSLYEKSQEDKWNKNANFMKIYRNFSFIFDIVKNSAVDDWTFEHGAEITQRMKKVKEEKKNGRTNRSLIRRICRPS